MLSYKGRKFDEKFYFIGHPLVMTTVLYKSRNFDLMSLGPGGVGKMTEIINDTDF